MKKKLPLSIILLFAVLLISIPQQADSQIQISSPPPGSEWCMGSDMQIEFAAHGAETVFISITEQSTSTMTVIDDNHPAAIPTFEWSIPTELPPGEYFITIFDVDNPENGADSDLFTLYTEPIITLQPKDQLICEGGEIEFEVVAEGYELQYQWQKNGNDIQGATSSILKIENASLSDEGNYSVEVYNPCNTIMSNPVHAIYFNDNIEITKQLSDTIQCVNDKLELEIGATGTHLRYKWYKNNQLLPAYTDSTFVIFKPAMADSGLYKVAILDTCDNILESKTVKIRFYPTPEITETPESIKACSDTKVQFKASAHGNDITYNWYHNGSIYKENGLDVLTFDKASKMHNGTYHLEVVDFCGIKAISDEFSLMVFDSLKINFHPQDQDKLVGATVEFWISVEGDIKSYQWRKDGVPIEGETDPELDILDAQLEDAGIYDCVVYGDCNDVVSEPAKLTVSKSGHQGPKITFDRSVYSVGEVPLGKVLDKTFFDAIVNDGNETLVVNSIILKGDSQIEYMGHTSFELEPGEKENLPFKVVAGQNPDVYQATFEINSNVEDSPVIIVEAEAYINLPEHSSDSYDLGNVYATGNMYDDFSLINNSEYLMNIVSIGISGEDAENFEISPNLGESFVIDKNNSRKIPIIFTFSELRKYNATLVYQPEFSDPIEVEITGNALDLSVNDIDEISSIDIYPNPAGHNVTIRIKSSEFIKVQADIFDAQGKKVYTFGEVEITGISELKWNGTATSGAKVASGAYYLYLNSKNGNEIQKIIIE